MRSSVFDGDNPFLHRRARAFRMPARFRVLHCDCWRDERWRVAHHAHAITFGALAQWFSAASCASRARHQQAHAIGLSLPENSGERFGAGVGACAGARRQERLVAEMRRADGAAGWRQYFMPTTADRHARSGLALLSGALPPCTASDSLELP